MWPVFLLFSVIMAIGAWQARGLGRGLAFVGAAVLSIVPIGLGVSELIQAWNAAQRRAVVARLHTITQTETVIDGITIPAGTQVTWTDASHTGLYAAFMRQPTTVFGFSTQYIHRDEELRRKHEWNIVLEQAKEISGWPCAVGDVRISPEGALRWCKLSRQAEWKGWTLPEKTGIELHGQDGSLKLSLPPRVAVFAREIGQPPSWWGNVSLNGDGSLDSVMLSGDKPFVACDTPLFDTVRWRYDVTTFGEGRARPPVAVTGRTSAPRGGHPGVVVHLSDCAVARESDGKPL